MTVQILFLFSLVLALVLVWVCSRYLHRRASLPRWLKWSAALAAGVLVINLTIGILSPTRSTLGDWFFNALFYEMLFGTLAAMLVALGIILRSVVIAYRRRELTVIAKRAVGEIVYHAGSAIAGVFGLLGALAAGLTQQDSRTSTSRNDEEHEYLGPGYDPTTNWSDASQISYPLYLDTVAKDQEE